jgi:hypothetical protein
LRLCDFEVRRKFWFEENLPVAKVGPAQALDRLRDAAAALLECAPEARRKLFASALILLLDAASRAGLAYSELQSYRFKTEPGWRNCLHTLCALRGDPRDREHFSIAFCCLWHAASSCKVWRQDVIRTAAATLTEMQLRTV